MADDSVSHCVLHRLDQLVLVAVNDNTVAVPVSANELETRLNYAFSQLIPPLAAPTSPQAKIMALHNMSTLVLDVKNMDLGVALDKTHFIVDLFGRKAMYSQERSVQIAAIRGLVRFSQLNLSHDPEHLILNRAIAQAYDIWQEPGLQPPVRDEAERAFGTIRSLLIAVDTR